MSLSHQYTSREYAEMHLIYGECGGIARRAALYRERFPRARLHPDYRVFIRLHNAYVEGRIPGQRGGEGRRLDNDDDVLDEIEDDPSTSVRAIQRRTGIPKSTVHNILKDTDSILTTCVAFKHCFPRLSKRIQFCRVMLSKIREDPNFLIKFFGLTNRRARDRVF
ncbi:hypothetical protein EVAR_79780_1 [Eumeta japonica]|uniref:DUF4817 domain-containing protein n=1 Tax=Eumeta variegata TaxID=151549 RepID=A0A4C1TCJ6_EUMVA|nr:hypothetical protein EVAR_79780_1 [Eumeta japonica]